MGTFHSLRRPSGVASGWRAAGRLTRRRAPGTLPLDLHAALLAGRWFADLRARGEGIGVQACLQAGICLRYGLRLGTRNHRQFSRIPGLALAAVTE